MRDDPNPTLPPPHVLAALRQPRRTQLHDPCVRELLAKWRRLGRSVTFDEVNELVDIVVPGAQIDLQQIDRIVAAVEAAGIRIARDTPRTDWGSFHARMTACGIGSYQLTGEAMADLSWHIAAEKYQLTPDQMAVLRRNPRKTAAGTPVPEVESPEWEKRLKRKWAMSSKRIQDIDWEPSASGQDMDKLMPYYTPESMARLGRKIEAEKADRARRVKERLI